MKTLVTVIVTLGFAAGLVACGDQAKPGTAASGTATAAAAKPAPTGTAAATGEAKKEDSGW